MTFDYTSTSNLYWEVIVFGIFVVLCYSLWYKYKYGMFFPPLKKSSRSNSSVRSSDSTIDLHKRP